MKHEVKIGSDYTVEVRSRKIGDMFIFPASRVGNVYMRVQGANNVFIGDRMDHDPVFAVMLGSGDIYAVKYDKRVVPVAPEEVITIKAGKSE